MKLRVWDLPTRVFHWSFAAAVTAAIVSAKVEAFDWHFRFGYAALALLAFRLVWGVVGPRYARFAGFVAAPARALAYLRGAPHDAPGHNPLGAWSVLALLVIVGVQAVTGLFTSDDVMASGPLIDTVASGTADLLGRLHRFNATTVYAIVALHVGAVVFYARVKRKPLVPAMLTGDAEVAMAAPPARDDALVRLGALALLAACSAGVWWLATLLPASAG
ncbi:cytochrome b/b6 domain-containing protein [Derxia lacustris]|uniref:cytochrome b/b6 domain-containing protein n=1 Tax=Derxia lacustris TaxID=764842 RepID=UPI000A17545F|nr:cytochrome b/b6 domain-containing protein [Derxia lacustris]